MPTKWVRAWICCPKHFQRNVTDPKGPANIQKPLQWNLPFIISFQHLTHLSVFPPPFCPFHQLIFFLLTFRWRGAVRNCYVRSVSLVCRRNIPQIILPLKCVSLTKSGPIAIDLPRLLEEKSRKLGERTTLKLRAQSIQYLGITKWWVASSPHCRGDLETLTSSSGAFIWQAGHQDALDKNLGESWGG